MTHAMISVIEFLNRLGYHPDSTSIDQDYKPANIRPDCERVSSTHPGKFKSQSCRNSLPFLLDLSWRNYYYFVFFYFHFLTPKIQRI